MTLIDTLSDAVLAFTRSGPDETLLVLINLSNEPQSDYDLGGLAAGDVLLGSAWTEGGPIPPQTIIVAEVSG